MRTEREEQIFSINQEIAKTERSLRAFLRSRIKYQNEIIEARAKIAKLKKEVEKLRLN